MTARTYKNIRGVSPSSFDFYEFFSGGGMARIGLGESWNCLFSNDFDEKKVAAYRANFSPAEELHHGDVEKVTTKQLAGNASLAWASFPCQDLSLAGNGKGLAGNRSGVFWSFWKLMQELHGEKRRPPIIALENVSGLITSHKGQDLTNLVDALVSAGYQVGALSVDGSLFTAQSRPRLFIIAVSNDVEIPRDLILASPHPLWHPQKLRDVINKMPSNLKKSWVWWDLPVPDEAPPHILDIIESEPVGVSWHTPDVTTKILDMMSPVHIAKIAAAKAEGNLVVGTAYKRTRNGIQCAEVRFDGKSGCLRTPSGGSSRQIVVVVNGDSVRTRLISPRETARLMGLPEHYCLPTKYNDTYHLTGDGVVVPVVSWLSTHIFTPLAAAINTKINANLVKNNVEIIP